MPIFFLKSLLGLLLSVLAFFAFFTMHEIFGRVEKKTDIQKLKRLHKINGYTFLALFLVIGFLCMKFIYETKGELSPRANLHSALALAVFVLLLLKISFVRVYKAFYKDARTLGTIVVVLTLVMFGSSGGYYLLVTKLGLNLSAQSAVGLAAAIGDPIASGNAERGKEIFAQKCASCHDTASTRKIVGPGLQGILKNPVLPVSGRPATLENVAGQIRKPFQYMPAFPNLSDQDLGHLLSFLRTL
ncbi:MAG: cytochrome c [Acidobacteriota bacterium]